MANLLNKCRLCLNAVANLINIFDEESLNENIAYAIKKHFWFEIKKNDLNTFICAICSSKVDDFHSFYTKVYKLHNECYNIHEIVNVKIKDECYNKSKVLDDSQLTVLEPKYENENNSVKNSSNNLGRMKCSDDQGTEMNQTNVIFDNNSDNCVSDKGDVNNENESYEKNPIISVKIDDIELSEDHSSEMNFLEVLLDDNSESSISDESDGKQNSEIVKSLKHSQRLIKKQNTIANSIDKEEKHEKYKQIEEYFTMECDICQFRCDTFRNIQIHYRKEHKMNGYIRCCNRKFKKMSTLGEHRDRHLNPNKFKCDVCNKSYATKHGLSVHRYQHLPSEEKPFKCTKCPKRYARNVYLESHLATTHNEKKFACNNCDKSFSTNQFLEKHTKNMHTRANIHVCDVCAKEFRSIVVFEQHQKTVHQNIVLPKVPCQVCGKLLKNKYILKRHMFGHEDSKSNHFCSICGKKSLNRKALHKHVKTVHSGIVYNCNLCEKTFKKQISLTEHMASHTGAILYSCPHCPKTFNSSANMYWHKKKMHVKEWEEQERLKRISFIGVTN